MAEPVSTVEPVGGVAIAPEVSSRASCREREILTVQRRSPRQLTIILILILLLEATSWFP